MKFSRFWMLAVFFICSNMTIMAQLKYCMTFDDFVADKWELADNASVKPIDAAKRRIINTSDFHVVSSDKELSDRLNKKAYAVMDGPTLYVNCRHYRYQGLPFGPGYAYGFRYDNNKICIVNRKIGKGELLTVSAITSVLPVAPATVVGFGLNEAQIANKVCYLVDSAPASNGRTKIKYMGDQFMKELLADKAEAKAVYEAAGEKANRQSAANVLNTLVTAGLIKK